MIKVIKTCGNLKDFLPMDPSRNFLAKIVKTMIGRLSAKVAHNQIEHTAGSRSPESRTADTFAAIEDTDKMKL